ncbi:MAG: GNAT family N-acetyltransferase [Planctomycetota bacterium]
MQVELRLPSLDSLDHAIRDRDAFARATESDVPGDWPPEHLEAHVLDFVRSCIQRGDEHRDWGLYWIISTFPTDNRPCIAGIAGFTRPPEDGSEVEIGYSVVPSLQGRGIATRSVQMLLDKAREAGIRRVVAHTLLDHDGSIGVLEKQNFVDSGQVPGPGIRRYVLDLQND